MITKQDVTNWFDEVSTYLEKSDFVDILNKFNADETAFMLCPKGEKVLGIKGQRNVYEVHSGSDKEILTVLNNVNAAGTIAPTMIVYPDKRLPQSIYKAIPLDWSIGRSDKSWTTGENLYEYVVNIFFPWINEQKIQLPIIMFLDGHKSHLPYFSKFCREHKIILISLPPNATHFMYTLDVSVFGPLKRTRAQEVQNWRLRVDAEI